MYQIRKDRVRLRMKNTVSVCVRGSEGYLIKMGLGSLMTMKVLFIMILPEKEMGLEKLVEHQCGIPGTGTKYY